MKIPKLEEMLKRAWCEQTTKNWSPENPALGHCAVTALVVQDYLGGDIVRTEAVLPDEKKDPHYYNIIDGQEIDLTKQQFPERTIIPKGIEKLQGIKEGKPIGPFRSTREYILAFPETAKRYDILKLRVWKEYGCSIF